MDLSPDALTYFEDKAKVEKSKQISPTITIHNLTADGSNVNLGPLSYSTMTIENTISSIEKEIEAKGGDDKETLRNLLEEIKELCDNIRANKSLPKSKSLMNRISKHFETHRWFYGAVVQLIGTAAMQVMVGTYTKSQYQHKKLSMLSYETVIKQVKMLPEPLLVSVSPFIKLLESAQCNFTESHADLAKPKNKQTFFALVGKLYLDQNVVSELREVSLI